jgi:hypothetical protein
MDKGFFYTLPIEKLIILPILPDVPNILLVSHVHKPSFHVEVAQYADDASVVAMSRRPSLVCNDPYHSRTDIRPRN